MWGQVTQVKPVLATETQFHGFRWNFWERKALSSGEVVRNTLGAANNHLASKWISQTKKRSNTEESRAERWRKWDGWCRTLHKPLETAVPEWITDFQLQRPTNCCLLFLKLVWDEGFHYLKPKNPQFIHLELCDSLDKASFMHISESIFLHFWKTGPCSISRCSHLF